MKIQTIAILTFLTFTNVIASEITTVKDIKSIDMDTLELTQEWDKRFPQSDKVEHSKIPSITATVLRLPQTCINRKIRKDVWLLLR